MRPESRICFMIHIVFDQRNRVGQSEILNALAKLISGRSGRPHPLNVSAFRRGPFQMAHVEIDAPGIGEKSAVPGRFIVPAMMQVEHAAPLDLKKWSRILVANQVGE